MDIGTLKISPDEDNEEVRAALFPIEVMLGLEAVWEAPSGHHQFILLERLHTDMHSM